LQHRIQQQQQQQLQQLQQQQRHGGTRRRLDVQSIPMLRTPSKQQRAPPPGSGRQEQEQQAPSAADWREVVERARRMGGHVSGEQMLTDTFRCDLRRSGTPVATAVHQQWPTP
jgi:hypothetical protein